MRPQRPEEHEILGPYAFSHVIGRAAATGAGVLYPLDLAVDEQAGQLHVVCRQQPRVSTWTLDGEYVTQYGHPGSVQPEGQPGLVDGELFFPASIAFDGTDTVYVAVGEASFNGLTGDQGIWKSTDGGQTWTNTTAASGLPDDQVILLAFSKGEQDSISYSCPGLVVSVLSKSKP